MKIEFENEMEKKILKHILTEWFIANNDNDVLGCEPACRDLSSPGCDTCIERAVEFQLSRNGLSFQMFGGDDWVLNHTIIKEKEDGIN